ncbi:hypothetical protein LFL97_24465 [Burkholderia sp. JSH-S8]|uniref:hypothetical protein n=1 Tax=Burkholderia stagnalis TaxID=1503054 RepID=UPI000756D1BD|nr:hypothetical protein [Burkholderia stagnalis]WGS45864.1 hypothetical protein LFL97_24465 [Burkholderia sp. JSH-S8]
MKLQSGKLNSLATVAEILSRCLNGGLPVMRARWHPATPLVAALDAEHHAKNHAGAGISAARLRQIQGEFSREAAERVNARHPALAAKLGHASPH